VSQFEICSRVSRPVFLTRCAPDFPRGIGVHRRDAWPPAVRPPRQLGYADKLTGVTVRVSEVGGRYPSALCGRCVL
jgi:hypothetical protein